LLKFGTQNPNLDTPTEYALTASPTTPSTSTVTDPQPASGAVHVQTWLNDQSSDHAPYSIPSSPSSIGSIPPLLSETEVDSSDLTNPSVLSDVFQDSRPSQPTEEPAASSDRIPQCQSLPSPPHSCVCFPQRTAGLNTGTPVPTSPVPSQMNTGESQPFSSPPAPQCEISSVIEAGVTPSPQSPTRDPLPGEVSDTRQQEPPFMTDGRGRVVWSHSGVKRGNSPPSNRDRTPNTAGDRN